MPGYVVSPLAVVNQIKSNLQDRYQSGYPILKELLQNADDAGSRRFRLEIHSGWPGARNPLLQGPGVLVVNDGTFSDDDRRGILSFGESVKAGDHTAIGKFGLGQKSVFHLCDAFIVHAVGFEEPFTRVVNPFLKVEVTGNVTDDWEDISDTDADHLREAAADFGQRSLMLWLPLRRDGLKPAPGAGFSTHPDPATIADDLARTRDLQVVMTALRHLERIEVRHDGETLASIHVIDAAKRLKRLTGPHDRPCNRSFGGKLDTGSGHPARFVGREATIQDSALERLRCSKQWPTTISALSLEPKPEKGERHGAVTLLRTSNPAQQSELRISWAVFLPISDSNDQSPPPIDLVDLGPLHLLLHGYFFLDSGRRRIEGIDDPTSAEEPEEPADEAELRSTWNTRLRDTAVLPLIPALLKDALDQGMLTVKEFADMIKSVAGNRWFQDHRTAICRDNALVRTLEGPEVPRSRRIAWHLVPTGVALRTLPASLAARPERVDALFDGIHQWTQARNLTLCIDGSASLTAQSTRWMPDELDSLFAVLSPRAFQEPALARLLKEVLSEVGSDDHCRTALAPHLLNSFRQATSETITMAPSDDLSYILQYVPRDRLFALPKSVELREVLRALASSNARTLPVRNNDLLDASDQSPVPEEDLSVLLRALVPPIDGEAGSLADQAASAALALLAGHDIATLARRQAFRDIKVIKVRDPRATRAVVLSFGELLAHSEQGLLFRRAPNVERHLLALGAALPAVRPLVMNEIEQLTCTANKQTFFHLINRASDFGADTKRARMIKMLPSLGGDDEPGALRKLCAGKWEAGPTTTLWNADRFPTELERIIDALVQVRPNEFLVPTCIIGELTVNMKGTLQIRDLDTPQLEKLFENKIGTFATLQPTPDERAALLKTDLPPDVLRRLPIHDRSDHTVGSADGLYQEAGWPIPDRLAHCASVVELADDPQVRSRQKLIIPEWGPEAQIEAALGQREPHSYQEEILDALSQCDRDHADLPPPLKERLGTVKWLVADGAPVAPKDVLRFPPPVEEAAVPLFAGSSRYILAGRLSGTDASSSGLRYAEEHLFQDHRSSITALARTIAGTDLQGRLGAADDYPIDRFTELANMDADLQLPGWRLLAAILSAVENDSEGVRTIIESFHGVSERNWNWAGRHLDALAEIAEHDAAHREVAEAAYRHGFKAVANWTEDARRKVFGCTRVPTKYGGWRSGTMVLAEDNGVDAAHVLAGPYAAMLPIPNEAMISGDGTDCAYGAKYDELDIEVLRTRSVTQHRAFLDRWRGSIPSEMVTIYLGLVGNTTGLESYCKGWSADATVRVDREIKELEGAVPPTTLVLIEEIQGESVKAIALAGDWFHAPLGDQASSGLVVGNRHKRSKYLLPDRGPARRTRIITIDVRTTDPRVLSSKERVQIFRDFIETAAAEWLSDEKRGVLRRALDRASNVEQATLEDTCRLLCDRLPVLLEALKLRPGSRAHSALRFYQEEESRAPDKLKLWQSISDRSIAAEVLDAVRTRIKDHGYNASRVLFELFQNADDAYAQRDACSEGACFRVDFDPLDVRRLRIVHWGRPINHLGSNAEEGRRRGYDRDLLNMLVMDFSEKRPEEAVTGKFGLGFKCVHLLSDGVGIASGFIALRTVGGILPEPWQDGLSQAEELSYPDRGKATVIDVPYTTEKMADDGRRTEQEFRHAMTWLPAFARCISRIEVRGSVQGTVDCSVSCLADKGGGRSIKVVVIEDLRKQTQRALRLELGNGYSLLLKITADGPECFEPSVARVWNLAPLEEDVRSGWLLNGPFPVDPGRGRLAGSLEDRRKRFIDLGRTLGDRLLNLHDLVVRDWRAVIHALCLDGTADDERGRFWTNLFKLMKRDLDDDLARCMHSVDRGYGRLVGKQAVVPTGLRRPFDALVCASRVKWSTDKALTGTNILPAASEWQYAQRMKDRVVAPAVATVLKKLGFHQVRRITLTDLLRMEMGKDKHIDVELGIRLGRMIAPKAVEKQPMLQERDEILDVAREAVFRAQDGTWRPVRELSSRKRDDEGEFAPDAALLNEEYRGDALEFFEVARRQSGYSPGVMTLRKWVDAAQDERRQRAVLRYLVRGRQGRVLANKVRDDLPTWMADIPEQVASHRLLDDWTEEEWKKLTLELVPERLEFRPDVPDTPSPTTSDISMVLGKLHQWWLAEGHHERSEYEESVYPQSFSHEDLADTVADTDSRIAWFTMFALACYQLFGRSQDKQHRNFIQAGWRYGWWAELAQSRPPDDKHVQPWLDRLEDWSAPDLDQTYHQWERTLVDLYTIARGLDEYVELMRKLPRVVEEHGRVRLDDILRPSYSTLVQPLGLDAAPIDRSLGIGANWLIRELSRHGVYDSTDAKLLAPYCYAPSRRVRVFLNTLDPWFDLTADVMDSAAIHDFICRHVEPDRVSFCGDFDLPLQIITRNEHRDRLNGWFELAGLGTPEFGNESEDGEDYA